MKSNVNIPIVVETKIVQSFPMAQFLIEVFPKPLKLDVSDRSGGLLVYLRSHIPSHQLIKFKASSTIQAILFEINLRKEKWFFPQYIKVSLTEHQDILDSLSEIIDYYPNVYDNHIILGDFKMEPSQTMLLALMNNHNYTNLIRNNACFKGQGSCSI